MKRQVIVWIISVVLFSSAVVFAGSGSPALGLAGGGNPALGLAGSGNPALDLTEVKAATVTMNEKSFEPEAAGILWNGKTLAPLRDIAESLHAVVKWNPSTRTADIRTMSIDMCFVDHINENEKGTWELINPYGILTVGNQQDVIVFYEIGPMEKRVYQYRIIVTKPDGKVLKTTDTECYEISNLGMVGFLVLEDLWFPTAGNYTFEFQLFIDDEFRTMKEKILIVEAA